MSQTRPTRGPSFNRRESPYGRSIIERFPLAMAIHHAVRHQRLIPTDVDFWPSWGAYW